LPRFSWTIAWAAAGALVIATASLLALRRPSASARPGVRLGDVGPRLTSNQTSQPLALYGDGLERGMQLHLGTPFNRNVPIAVLDSRHGFLRLPADLDLPPSQAQVTLKLTLTDTEGNGLPGSANLTIVNDRHFTDLIALAVSRDGNLAFAISSTTDAAYAVNLESKKVTKIPVGDGPSAIARWEDPAGREWMVVTHEFAPEIHLVSVEGPGKEQRVLAGPSYATGIVIDPATGLAYIAEHAHDSVVSVTLTEGARVGWRAAVDPNPRAMAIAGSALAVGSLQTGQVQALELSSGKVIWSSAPGPETSIVGGRTEPFARYIMGGKAARDLAWSSRLRVLLVPSIGPNIGPNPDKWEVSPNGGIGVIDLSTARFTRHLGFGGGLTEGLAVDDEQALAYAADIGVGQVKIVDLSKLALSNAAARRALIQKISILPPEGFPSVRPTNDYGISGRAGIELHSGPKAVALTPDRRTLLVLNRFTGTLAVVDVHSAKDGHAVVREQIPIADTLTQPTRRMGQILYFTDVGQTSMTCDACHLEGHTEGVFFEKTHPLRIYRAPTVRGSRETPPYFTPVSTLTLAQTARIVGDRNRFHNPTLTAAEVEALSLYAETMVTLPNPYLERNGLLADEIELPDGSHGRPKPGLVLFEGKAQCAQCHPAPHFTTDQNPSTRGPYQNVGTPTALPIRSEMQDLFNRGFGTPSLLGAWDIFPMLTSGTAGFSASSQGTISVATRFPVRAVLEMAKESPADRPGHGNVQALTTDEINDLLAYVLSL